MNYTNYICQNCGAERKRTGTEKPTLCPACESGDDSLRER